MAFRLAASPAAHSRAWVAAVAAGTLALVLVAVAAGLWGGGPHALRGGVSGFLSSSRLLPGQQPTEAAALRVVQPALRGGLRPKQQGGAQRGGAAKSGPELPPLCGGASNVRRVADSLAASGQALMEGLEEAFQPYAQGFGLAEINATAAYLQADAEQGHVHTVIEVHNQTVTFPRRKNKECLDGCDSWFHLLKASLERGMQEGRLSIPEGVPFLVNVNDDSWCHVVVRSPALKPFMLPQAVGQRARLQQRARCIGISRLAASATLPRLLWLQEDGTSKCTAPLLSIFKSKFDRDILVPNFKPELFEPIFSPWENKKEIAFFRGSPICSFPSLNGTRPSPNSGANCSRWVVAQLSWDHPELINATLTENVTQYGGPLWVDMPRVSHQEAAEYKYVLAVDGATAAYRLAFLMATNSVVLKQVTDKIEWYYGAIHPCEHYFPFWVHNETDVVQLVQQLQGNPDNDLTAQHIAANSQAFALTHLSHEYAFWYWQALIDKYVALYRGPKRRGSGGGGSSGGGGGSEADAGSSGSSSSGPADTGEEGSSNGSGGDSSSIPAEPGAGGSKAGGGSEATPPDSSSEAG